MNRAKSIIVPSKTYLQLKNAWKLNHAKLSVIPNAVNFDLFPDASDKKDIDILTVCRLVKWKKVDLLIESSHLANKKLFVVGDGPELKNLTNLAQEFIFQSQHTTAIIGKLKNLDNFKI